VHEATWRPGDDTWLTSVLIVLIVDRIVGETEPCPAPRPRALVITKKLRLL
jgi:hypothetical protein